MGRRLVLVVVVALVALFLQASFSPAPAAGPSLQQSAALEPSSSDQRTVTINWNVNARLNKKLPWTLVAIFPVQKEADTYAAYLRTLGYLTQVVKVKS